MKRLKALCLFTITLISNNLLAQRYSYEADHDDVELFNKYSHLNLPTHEWVMIGIGIVLLLVHKNMKEEGKSGANAVGCLGIIAALPLILIIIAVAQKAIGYGILLAAIVGVLYLVFKNKD